MINLYLHSYFSIDLQQQLSRKGDRMSWMHFRHAVHFPLMWSVRWSTPMIRGMWLRVVTVIQKEMFFNRSIKSGKWSSVHLTYSNPSMMLGRAIGKIPLDNHGPTWNINISTYWFMLASSGPFLSSLEC